jgi:hypothetical protein
VAEEKYEKFVRLFGIRIKKKQIERQWSKRQRKEKSII